MNRNLSPDVDHDNVPFEIDPEAVENVCIALYQASLMCARAMSICQNHLEDPEAPFDLEHYGYNRAQIASCKMVLDRVYDRFHKAITPPDEASLWTSDAISAEIVEAWHYEATQEVTRINDEIRTAQSTSVHQISDFVNSEYAAVLFEELEEQKAWRNHCANSLSTNPKSAWLPF